MSFDKTRPTFADEDIDGSLNLDGGPGTPYKKAVVEATMAVIDRLITSKKGDHVLVIGRSETIGRAVAKCLLDDDKTVTVAHSKTGNERLRSLISRADIVVSTAPYGTTFPGKWLHNEQILIDVGNNFNLDYWKCINFGSITATPKVGGVGAITRAIIVDRLVDNYESRLVKELS